MKKLLSLVLAMVMLAGTALAETRVDPGIAGNLPEDPQIGDSFITWACYDWLSETTLPEGKARWTAFGEVEQKVQEQMYEMLDQEQEDPAFKLGTDFYHMLLDNDTRTASGLGRRTIALADAVLACTTIEEFAEVTSGSPEAILFSPFLTFYVEADLKNSTMNALYLSRPSFFLPDPDCYANPTELGNRYLDAERTCGEKLLVLYGMSQEDAAATMDRCFEMEALIAAGCYPLSVRYQANYHEVIYNPTPVSQLEQEMTAFPLMKILQQLGVETDTIIVYEPEALKNLNTVFTQENLEGLKAYYVAHLLK